jgi:hypothetical protein
MRCRPRTSRSGWRRCARPAARTWRWSSSGCLLHWRKSKTWHYGDIRIAGGEISWQSADGSRTLPFTNACRSLAAQPPGGRPRRRTTLIGDNDARILVDLPLKVLVALAQDL